MKMLPFRSACFSSLVNEVSDAPARFLVSAKARLSWGELARSAVELPELRGSSVVLAMRDQVTAAAAMVQLDGVVRRMVLVAPDVARQKLESVVFCAEAEFLLEDGVSPGAFTVEPVSRLVNSLSPKERSGAVETEWVLLTSGTTGQPKLVVHTLRSLTGAIQPQLQPKVTAEESGTVPPRAATPMVWSTFYDIRRYGGLQIFLRAALAGCSLVVTDAVEPLTGFLVRAGAEGVTHISGTPSHWRRALMSPTAGEIRPRYVRLSGEIADGALLEQLKRQYPGARVAHAFASTEAGVTFEVTDGEMGLPASLLERGSEGVSGAESSRVEMRIEGGTLRVRSDRTARRYLGGGSPRLRDEAGFVDTGDVLELKDGRYYFAGRHDGTINVGGQKVHPEEVEAVINAYPGVQMSLVRTKSNPITGALVVAEVVLKASAADGRAMQQELLAYCRKMLARHKVPAAIQIVPALEVAETGKMVRRHG